jgi:hypothetical protein
MPAKINDGLTNVQRYQKRHPEKVKAAAQKWRDANPNKERNKHLLRKFGITLEQYEKLFEEQNGVCAMCFKPETVKNNKGTAPRLLAVDHDHKTGRIRGLLCFRCNTMLDHFDKDLDKIKRVLAYIKEHNK